VLHPGRRDARSAAMRIRLAPVAFAAAFAAVLAAPAAAATFDPLTFFAGHTEGRGTLKVVVGPHTPVIVHGRGHVDGDGSLVLEQTVVEGRKRPGERRWTFRALGGGRYAGTLSDAAGPVVGEVAGPRLHLHFHMRGGIVADQRLDLSSDGQQAHNRMTFRKLGVIVARLDETIRRVP